MTLWIRFEHEGQIEFGTVEGDTVSVYSGDMFNKPAKTGRTLPLASVRPLAPTVPSKMIALWNNFHALAEKLNQPVPTHPMYLLKANSCIANPLDTVRRPASYAGRIVYEGELAIVIGKACTNASEAEAEAAIFGYTCVNDITASDIINEASNFAQWVRAKSFDGFGPFGPVIVTGLKPETLVVRTILNGQERQNYPISDMVFTARQIVSKLSQDMTLLPGDVICVGTSVGVGVMKEPINTVEIAIDGIGVLTNKFEQ